MQIKVDEQTVEQFFKGGSTILVVPDYQRPYSWENGQLSDFWEDINNLDAEDIHFIGSVVLISEPHIPGNFNKLEIVDGQQRLTTISILLKSIQDKYKELGNNNDSASLDSYFYSEVLRRGRQLKLQLGKGDRGNFENMLNGRIDLLSDTLVGRAYNFFKDKLVSLEQVNEILDKIIYKLSFVTIVTDSDKSAYRLFETLNDRGLDLSAVDLIKNYLLKESTEKNISPDKIKILWEGIIDDLQDIDKVRYFRQYLLSSKIVETRGKVSKEGLYDKFSEVIQKSSNITDFIEDIKKQSLLYNKINNSSINDFSKSKNEDINIHLRNIEAIKATTSYTLLLRAFNELVKPEDILRLLELIEVFAVRRNIVGVSTSDLDLIYNKLALDSFIGDVNWYSFIKNHLEKNMPSDFEFEAKFKSVQFQQNDQTKYILDKLEESFGAGENGKRVCNSFSVHIEHIAPQTMNNLSSWNGFSELDTSEQKEFITSIGNLTLLEKKPNIKASNNGFDIKKTFYGKDKTEMLMTNELLKYEQWGVLEIKERADDLAKRAVKIWKFND